MNVNSIQLQPGNSFKLSPVTTVNGSIDFSFQLDMIMNISVTNTNRYHLKVENIDLTVNFYLIIGIYYGKCYSN